MFVHMMKVQFAVSGLRRCLTEVCIAAGGTALADIVQEVLQLFQAQLPPHLSHAADGNLAVSSQGRASLGWQCKAASAVMVLSEVLFGASAAWDTAQPAGNTPHPQQHESHRQHVSPEPQQPSHQQSSSSHQQPSSSHISSRQQASSSQPHGGNQAQHTHTSQQPKASHPQGPADPAGSGEAARLRQAAHAELEGLVAKALEDFSSSGVWRLVTHQELDMNASQTPLLTPQASSPDSLAACDQTSSDLLVACFSTM